MASFGKLLLNGGVNIAKRQCVSQGICQPGKINIPERPSAVHVCNENVDSLTTLCCALMAQCNLLTNQKFYQTLIEWWWHDVHNINSKKMSEAPPLHHSQPWLCLLSPTWLPLRIHIAQPSTLNMVKPCLGRQLNGMFWDWWQALRKYTTSDNKVGGLEFQLWTY